MTEIHGRRPVVMLVDDEPMVTQSLSLFLELESDYEVASCSSGAEALDRLSAGPVDVVVSDFLMPGMNGLELLGEVARRDPEIPRLMLTGYADKENTIRAINEVGLFQYLEKPLENEQLLLALTSALAHKGVRAALHEKIQELDRVLRRHDELAAKDEEMKKEMDWARSVQARFLPGDPPPVEPFAVADPASGQVRLVGAGLPHPLVMTAAGEVNVQQASGLLLGLVDGSMYTPGKETVLDLAPGDGLLLFSDGLSEAQDTDDVFYGEGPLQGDLADLTETRAQDFLEALADRALDFGAPEYRDDLTLVALIRTDGGERG